MTRRRGQTEIDDGATEVPVSAPSVSPGQVWSADVPSVAAGVPMSFDPAAALLRERVLDAPSRPGAMAALDRYEVLGVVGAGGMGVVLLARHPVTNAPVAIKLLRPPLVREPRAVHRFLVEARHMHHLRHPGILPVLEVSDRAAGPYYVMPYM